MGNIKKGWEVLRKDMTYKEKMRSIKKRRELLRKDGKYTRINEHEICKKLHFEQPRPPTVVSGPTGKKRMTRKHGEND